MTQKLPKFRKTNRNKRVPEHVTSELMSRVGNLPGSVKTDYLHATWLTKFVSKETDSPEVRRNRAIAKWLATERNNEATNVRLLNTPCDYQILSRVEFHVFVEKVQELITSTIGESFPLEALLGGFSGGATTSRKRTSSLPALKYLGGADVTIDALPWFEEVLSLCPGWVSYVDFDLRIVPGNVMFTVLKNTEIDRCACKEPDVNMYLQRGLGRVIRSGLRRMGIDLNDQSRNRELARIGSLDGSLATLDLSSASDSVSSELVSLLMPPIWYTALDALRCKETLIDGSVHRNEMFSSMGNGFTFELESLLFWALAKATAYFTGTPGITSVYGDDIVCPTPMAQDLIWVLEFFGFQTNVKKSFYEGPFRESCGGHFTNGLDITPFFLREPIERVTDVIHIANALRKWAQWEGLEILDPDVYDIWNWLTQFVPRSLRGGRDLDSITQLVTPEEPHLRLIEEVAVVREDFGGYLAWLDVCGRVSDYSTSSDPMIEAQKLAGEETRYWFNRVRAEGKHGSVQFRRQPVRVIERVTSKMSKDTGVYRLEKANDTDRAVVALFLEEAA